MRPQDIYLVLISKNIWFLGHVSLELKIFWQNNNFPCLRVPSLVFEPFFQVGGFYSEQNFSKHFPGPVLLAERVRKCQLSNLNFTPLSPSPNIGKKYLTVFAPLVLVNFANKYNVCILHKFTNPIPHGIISPGLPYEWRFHHILSFVCNIMTYN